MLLMLFSALGAVSLNYKLYVCGGYDGVSSLNSVEMYDESADQWTMISSMEKHRSASGVVVLNDQIYAIGGHDGLSIFDSVFIACFQSFDNQIFSPKRLDFCVADVFIYGNSCVSYLTLVSGDCRLVDLFYNSYHHFIR